MTDYPRSGHILVIGVLRQFLEIFGFEGGQGFIQDLFSLEGGRNCIWTTCMLSVRGGYLSTLVDLGIFIMGEPFTEDSPNLPLKVLHPLLEDGTEGAS